MNARIELARTAKRLRLSASACSADTGSFNDGCFKPDLTLLPVRLHGRLLLSRPSQNRGPSVERTSIPSTIISNAIRKPCRGPRRKAWVEPSEAITPFDCIFAPALATPNRTPRAKRVAVPAAHGRDASAPLMQPPNPCLWLVPGDASGPAAAPGGAAAP
jgi:hypothetical protein